MDLSKFNDVNAKLLFNTNLNMVSIAARTSHDSIFNMRANNNGSLKEEEILFLKRLIKIGHTSILEHVIYTFEIDMPRFILQELSRHRIGISPTVKSTRYTLKELFKDNVELEQFICTSDNPIIDEYNYYQLYQFRNFYKPFYENKELKIDQIKFSLPEFYMTRGIYTINGRALRHLFELRLEKAAHYKFRQLMEHIYYETPYVDVITYQLNINI